MRKQRDRCAKAGPVGSGLLRFGERRKREAEEGGGRGRGRKGQRRLEDRILRRKDRILRNLCFFQITVL